MLFLYHICLKLYLQVALLHTQSNMVHEIEGVPEELYNLTQLAEVSLAAGKLPPVYEKAHEQGNSSMYQMNHNHGWPDKKCDIDSRREIDNDDNKVLNYSINTSTKKKWKNEWEESCYQNVRTQTNENTFVNYPAANMFHTLSPSHTGDNTMNNHVSFTTTTTNSYQHHLQNYDSAYNNDRRSFSSSLGTDLTIMSKNSNNDTSRRNSLVSTSSSLASSSDDDSSLFSYSHKVFDRKKIRRNIENFGTSCISSSGVDNTNSMTNSAESDQGSVESGAEEIHTCPECGKKYSTSSNLARHRQTHR